MPFQTRIVSPGPSPQTVRTSTGEVLTAPDDWSLLPPGDAGLTRRVKAAGPTWTVEEKKGRKRFSRGVWAPTEHIERIRAELEVERSDPAYVRKLASGARRREAKQVEYVEDFRAAVLAFLNFAPSHQELAERCADAITTHATPVGSGTVARTQRIPIERRAEAAVIAWLRHQTTAYDDLKIARVKGQRREVRRQLAEQSRRLLDVYRRGTTAPAATCPLVQALAAHNRTTDA